MRSIRLEIWIIWLAASFAVLSSFGCGSSAGSLRTNSIPTNLGVSEAKIKFVDSSKFDFKIIEHWSDGDSSYLVDFRKFKKGEKEPLGRFLSLSNDGGRTFQSEIRVDKMFGGDRGNLHASFVGEKIAVIALEAGDFTFSISKTGLEGWSEPTRINDSPKTVSAFSQFVAIDQNRFTVVWQDSRIGDLKIFSSRSTDGGKTWSLNQPVDGEFPGDNQESASLAIGANDRLILTWSDWRAKDTLVDIRYSISDDLGLTWSRSKILNDDKLEVWQMKSQVLAEGANVFVAFSDFREKGEDDDGDWNIYFSTSSDNGETWSENKRLNHIATGRQSAVQCAKSKPGGFYCSFASTDKSIFGQIMVAASIDSGATWSKETPISSIEGFDVFAFHTSVVFSDGRFVVRFPILKMNSVRNPIIVAEPGFPPADEKELPNQNIPPLEYSLGKQLFSDDFSGAETNQWNVSTGNWRVEDGLYKGDFGFRSQNHHTGTFKTFADFREPDRYVFTGKFMLDPIYHDTASIYLRVGEDKYFVVTNQFRRGAWLSYEKDSTRNAENVLETGLWSEEPLASKRFSFKNDTWYRFKIVVTEDQIDYYVNEKHYFSAADIPKLKNGSIGLGGHALSPVYFDDINVSELIK